MKTFSSRVYTVTVAAHSVSLSQAIERQIYTQPLCFIFQWNFYLYSRCVFCLPAHFHQSIDPFISFHSVSVRMMIWQKHNRENRVNIYVAFKNIYALSTFDGDAFDLVSRCSFDTSNMIFFFLLLFRLKSSWIGNMIGDHASNMWYIYRLYFGTVTSSFFLVIFRQFKFKYSWWIWDNHYGSLLGHCFFANEFLSTFSAYTSKNSMNI